jgi:nucleolar protein 58
MARMVATKASLSIRVDALSDAESRSDPQAAEIGITNRVKLESRLRALEHQAGIQSTRKVVSGVNGRQQSRFEMTSGAGQYNSAADSQPLGGRNGLLPTQPQEGVKSGVEAVLAVKDEQREAKDRDAKKKEKKEKRKSEVADISMMSADVDGDESMIAGETKEERRARKEAKRAVSTFVTCMLVV